MLRNENLYADEIAKSLGKPRDPNTEPFVFTDVTSNNQNMRVGTSASSTIVYAFAKPEILLISSTVEGLLALRSVILR
jgi:hypothetical protein